MKKFTLRHKKGFTLIELLMVVAIIALLSAVVTSSLVSARMKSRDGRRIADLRQVRLALEMYYDSFQTYPTTTALQLFGTGTTGSGTAMLVPVQIAKLPQDPKAGASYFYCAMTVASSSDCNSGPVSRYFALGANLEMDVTLQKALDADADKTVGTVFNGDHPDCSSTAGGPANEKCFDTIP